MNVIKQKLNEQQVKTNAITEKQTTTLEEQIVPKKINKKKLAISFAAGLGISAAVVGGIMYKRKIDTKSIKKLAENIDFINSDTLDDAIKFGKEHLGIKNYKGFKEADLDVVNWINEGLVRVNNTSKGKAKMPNEVIYENIKDIKIAGTMSQNGILTISKSHIKLIKDSIKSLFKEDQVEQCVATLNNKNNFKYWENTFINIVNKHPEIAKKIGKANATCSFGTIYHEMGHLQHLVNTNSNFTEIETKYADLFKNSIETAKKLSDYAATDPTEFVAECFTKLCYSKQHGGKQLEPDILELYKKLGGFMI